MVKRLASEDAKIGGGIGSGGGLRCVQHAGDMLVLPVGWGHLTLNLKTSVGVAKEFHIDPANGRMRFPSG